MNECQAVTKSGRSCRAAALIGGDFCYMHEPSRASERSSARRLGGMRHGSHGGALADVPRQVRTIQDVLALLDYTAAELVCLDNGIQRSRALIALSGAYISALEAGEFEERLEALEAEILHVKNR